MMTPVILETVSSVYHSLFECCLKNFCIAFPYKTLLHDINTCMNSKNKGNPLKYQDLRAEIKFWHPKKTT